MTPMTEVEWERVQEALCVGGLRECVDNLLTSRLPLSDKNRQIISSAYDDGDGHNITLVPTDDYPWFSGMWEDQEVYLGMEYDGILFSVVHASGGYCAVIVGRGIIENEIGVVFHEVDEAKAYVKGLTAK